MGCSLNLTWDVLPGLFPGFEESTHWLPLLRRHAELVDAAAEHTRVTAVEGSDVIRRHYAESLELLRIADEVAGRSSVVVDVGSGGGYPGLVIACVRPESMVHLVEPLQKRARLLDGMVAELGLTNVRVHAIRAEEAGRGELRVAAGLVTARAVAALPELLEYTAPLGRDGGWLAFPKGSAAEDELAAAENAVRLLNCRYAGTVAMRPEISEAVGVVLFERRGAVDPKYPRRPGMPRKRPL